MQSIGVLLKNGGQGPPLATFSHKGRREERALLTYDFHNLTSGPSAPITGSVFGNLNAGIVFSAFT